MLLHLRLCGRSLSHRVSYAFCLRLRRPALYSFLRSLLLPDLRCRYSSLRLTRRLWLGCCSRWRLRPRSPHLLPRGFCLFRWLADLHALRLLHSSSLFALLHSRLLRLSTLLLPLLSDLGFLLIQLISALLGI